VRGTMSRNDVPLTMVSLRTMDGVLHESLVVARVVTGVLITIGGLALLLAAVGLYGVVSYVMQGRTREFGVRIALGAGAGSIRRLVLGYGVRLAVVGGVAGTALGLLALRALGTMIVGGGSTLPLILAVAVVLGAVTLGACMIPARRAMRSSPAIALRAE
jgi:putative ABC transport system permease protein